MNRLKVIETAVLILLLGTAALGFAQEEQKKDKQDRPDKQAEPSQQRDHRQQEKPAAQEQRQDHNKQQAQQEQNRNNEQRTQEQEQQQQNKNNEQRAQQQEQNRNRQQAQQQQNKSNEQRPQQQDQDYNNRQAQQQQHRNNEQRAPQQQPNNNQQLARRQSNQPVQQRRTEQERISQQGEQRGYWQQRRARSFETEHRSWNQRGGYNGYRIPDSYFVSYYGSGHSFHVYGLPFMEVGGFPRFQYAGYWFSVVDPYPEFWGDDWYQTDDVYVLYADNGYYLYNSRYPGRPGVAISISF